MTADVIALADRVRKNGQCAKAEERARECCHSWDVALNCLLTIAAEPVPIRGEGTLRIELDAIRQEWTLTIERQGWSTQQGCRPYAELTANERWRRQGQLWVLNYVVSELVGVPA